MRYGRQRWRLRGRMEVSNKQIWDSEEYIFLPLVTELLSIKVMRSALKGQAGVIPTFSYSKQIPWKDQDQQCLTDLSFIILFLFI